MFVRAAGTLIMSFEYLFTLIEWPWNYGSPTFRLQTVRLFTTRLQQFVSTTIRLHHYTSPLLFVSTTFRLHYFSSPLLFVSLRFVSNISSPLLFVSTTNTIRLHYYTSPLNSSPTIRPHYYSDQLQFYYT